MIWKTAWLRDEWALADVWPDVLGPKVGQKNGRLFKLARRWCGGGGGGWGLIESEGETPDVPAAVAYFYQLQNLLCAFYVFLLETDHLDLLLAVLQDPQLSLTVQQVKHLQHKQWLTAAAPAADSETQWPSFTFKRLLLYHQV